MKIEAEGGEVALKNNFGDLIIVPKSLRSQALTALAKGGYAAIDEIAMKLPYMEDYADDGTVIPKGETKSTAPLIPKGIYTEEEFDDLKFNQYTNRKKFVKFGQLRNETDPSQGGYGCLGSACKNFKTLYPQFPGHDEDFSKAGVYGYTGSYKNPKGKSGIYTEDNPTKPSSYNTFGVDSWEWIPTLQQFNLGKVMAYYDLDAELKDTKLREKRLSELSSFDPKTIPIGAVLNLNRARGSGYIAPDAK
jgi:hypothetical protein